LRIAAVPPAAGGAADNGGLEKIAPVESLFFHGRLPVFGMRSQLSHFVNEHAAAFGLARQGKVRFASYLQSRRIAPDRFRIFGKIRAV
jgi:hypothetical protein